MFGATEWLPRYYESYHTFCSVADNHTQRLNLNQTPGSSTPTAGRETGEPAQYLSEKKTDRGEPVVQVFLIHEGCHKA